MKPTSKLLLAAGLAALTTGCVSKSTFNEHVAKHNGMRDALIDWSIKVNAWEGLTYHVICDIVAHNTADINPPYAPQTISYCPAGGTEGDGEPPDPPPLDQF